MGFERQSLSFSENDVEASIEKKREGLQALHIESV